MSDLFALSKICQGDVISLRPTMKVISQSKGISGEPWLLQRPGKLGPMTLFMCEVRQTVLSRRQLKWLMIFFFFNPINLPAYNPCAPLTFFTLAVCESPRQRDQTRQAGFLIVNWCRSANACTVTCSRNRAGRQTFLINMHLFKSTNKKFWIL